MKKYQKSFCFLFLIAFLVSCGVDGGIPPSTPSSNSQSLSETNTIPAVFQQELNLYEAVGIKENETLRILDGNSQKLLYEVLIKRQQSNGKTEGITAVTKRVGIFSLEEQEVYEEIELKEEYYISSGVIQNDGFLILGIALDNKDDRYYLMESKTNELVVRYEGITAPYFTQWPTLIPWGDGSKSVFWIPHETEEGNSVQARVYLISDSQIEEIPLPFQGELLSGNDLQIDGTASLSFWELEGKGQFVSWGFGKTVQMRQLPEKRKILDYCFTTEGVVACLQTEDLQSELWFLPFGQTDSYSLPTIPFYRMTSRNSNSLFCVNGNFNLYEIVFGDNQFNLIPVDLSPWTDLARYGPVSLLSIEEGKIIVHLEKEKKVLLFS